MSSRLPRTNWLAWSALLCGLVLTHLTWHYLGQQVDEDAAIAFEEQCREVRRAVENRLHAYAGLLQGLRALHAAEGGLAGSANDYLAVLEWSRRFPALERVQFRTGSAPPYAQGSLLPAGVPVLADEAVWLDSQGPIPVPAGIAVGHLPGSSAGEPLLTLAVDLAGGAPASRARSAPAGRVGLVVSLPRLVAEAVPRSVLRQLRLQLAFGAPDSAPLFDSMAAIVPAGLQRGPVGSGAAVLGSAAQVRIDDQVVRLQFSAAAGSYLRPLVQMAPTLALAAGVVASLLLFGVLHAMGGARRRLERAVADRTRDLQTVNRELREEVAERNRLEQAVFRFNVEERRRFAGELHESIGQRLEHLLQRLQAFAQAQAPDDPLHGQAGVLAGHLKTALDQGRMLGLGLRPPAVGGAQFLPALRQLAAEAAGAFGVQCTFAHDGGPLPEDDMLLHNLYRIVQQAVTNSVTHGHARQVRIELHTRGPLRLTVTDDGVGWTAAGGGSAQGIGLSIMRYRCAVLDLDLRMAAGEQGRGAAIVVEARPRSA